MRRADRRCAGGGFLTDAMANADIAVVAGKIVAASAERWEFQVAGNAAPITVSIFCARKPHASS